jgi:high-affinity nickel-transport protein
MRQLVFLLVLNGALWLLALTFYRGDALLLGSALLAWALGLRHALDADHIASIDNVTRALTRQGKQAGATGLFFSAGHSTVVALAATAAAYAPSFGAMLERLHGGLGPVGAMVSTLFLLYIAAANAMSLLRGDQSRPRGGLARLASPLFGLVRRSWQMFPLGLLFGLGFDTASEIALLALTARAATGVEPLAALLLPSLFAVAMALVDTADSEISARAYGWNAPAWRRRYDVVVTSLSIAAALLVAAMQALALAGRDVASLLPALPDGSGGALIALALLGSWGAALILHRHRLTRRP